MNNDFKKILNLLQQLNAQALETIVSTDNLKKEYRRIDDLTWLDNDTLKHLNLLRKVNPASIDKVMEEICYFNVNLNTYIWHIESIRDITEKFIMRDSKND